MTVRFLIVDDHPLFREALQLAIQSAYPEAEIVEASSIAAAQTALASEAPFDLLLLDLTLPGTRGFDGLIDGLLRDGRLRRVDGHLATAA